MAATITSIALAISGASPLEDWGFLCGGAISLAYRKTITQTW